MSSSTSTTHKRARSAPLGIRDEDVRPVTEGETDEGATELLEQGVEQYMALNYERAQQPVQ